MLDTYTVSFFGHRQIGKVSAIEKRLDTIIRPLLLEKEYVEFLVGRDGEFDQLVAATIKRLKRSTRDDNSALVVCYVERPTGGAFQTLRYAKRHGKNIIDVAELLSTELGRVSQKQSCNYF